jgi:spermidine/putrescine transport system permease protein
VNPAVSTGGRRGLWAFFGLLVVFLYAPIVILIIFSFNDREIVSFPWEGFTFRWYQEFLSNGTILSALKTSAVVALFTAVLTTALAIPAAIVLVRRRFFAKGFVSGVMLSPLVIPLVVFGISLLVLFNTIGFPLGLFSITIGHIVIALPFAILTLVPRLERIPSALEEASRDLGASGLTTFRLVTLPLMVPALISAALISYTISFDEVVVASFIAGDTTTFPLYLYSQLRLPENLPQVIAVAVVVMAVSVIVVVVSEVGRAIADRRLEHQTGVSADELEASLSVGKG